MPKESYISVSECANYLGVTTKTVRRMIAAGQLSGYRIGPRLLRIPVAEVEALFRPIPTTKAVGA